MQIQLPFDFTDISDENDRLRWEAIYQKERNTKGGVYPISVNGLWHTGIHLKEDVSNQKFIHPFMNGNLIAFKVADNYNSFENTDFNITFNYTCLFKLKSYKENRPEEYNEKFGDKTPEQLLNEIYTKKFEGNDKENLINVLNLYNTSFILTGHHFDANPEKAKEKYDYYVLYKNIAPISDFTSDRENRRLFYRKWTVPNNKISTAFSFIPQIYEVKRADNSETIRILGTEKVNLLLKENDNSNEYIVTKIFENPFKENSLFNASKKADFYKLTTSQNISSINANRQFLITEEDVEYELYYDFQKIQKMATSFKINCFTKVSKNGDKKKLTFYNNQEFAYPDESKTEGFLIRLIEGEWKSFKYNSNNKNWISSIAETPRIKTVFYEKSSTKTKIFISEQNRPDFFGITPVDGKSYCVGSITNSETEKKFFIKKSDIIKTKEDKLTINAGSTGYYLEDLSIPKYIITQTVLLPATAVEINENDGYEVSFPKTNNSIKYQNLLENKLAVIVNFDSQTHIYEVETYSPVTVSKDGVLYERKFYQDDVFSNFKSVKLEENFEIFKVKRTSTSYDKGGYLFRKDNSAIEYYNEYTVKLVKNNLTNPKTGSYLVLYCDNGKDKGNTDYYKEIYSTAEINGDIEIKDNEQTENLRKKVSFNSNIVGFLNSSSPESTWYGENIDRSTDFPEGSKKGKLDIFTLSKPFSVHVSDYIAMQSYGYDSDLHIELFTDSIDYFKTGKNILSKKDANNIFYFNMKGSYLNKLKKSNDTYLSKLPDTPFFDYFAIGSKIESKMRELYLVEKELFTKSVISHEDYLTIKNNKEYYRFEICKTISQNDETILILINRTKKTITIGTHKISKDKECTAVESNSGDINFLFVRKDLRKLIHEDDIPLCSESITTIDKYTLFYRRSFSHDTILYDKDFKKYLKTVDASDCPEKFKKDFKYRCDDSKNIFDYIRIKLDDDFYYFSQKDVKNIYLDSNFEKHKDFAILKFNTFGLPFFELLDTGSKSLKWTDHSSSCFHSASLLMQETSEEERFAEQIYGSSPEDDEYRRYNSYIIKALSLWNYTEKGDIKLEDYNYKNLVEGSDREKNIRDYIYNNMVFTDDVLSAMGIPGTKSFYYFHPIKFMNYAVNLCNFSFKHYEENEKITVNGYNKPDGTYVGKSIFEIKSDPCFIPMNYKRNYSQWFNEKKLKAKDPPNANKNNKIYRHEGVDISILRKECGEVPIISDTYGEVIFADDLGNVSYGKYIIIWAEQYKNYEKYFLLGHLDRNSFSLKKGDKVYPGSICGYVGNTGHCNSSLLKSGNGDLKETTNEEYRSEGYGAHLHLQLFLYSNYKNISRNKCDESFLDFIDAKNKDRPGPSSRGTSIYNPCNYEEEYYRNK